MTVHPISKAMVKDACKRAGMSEDEACGWLKRPHHALDGLSPSAIIGEGRGGEVLGIIPAHIAERHP